MGRQEHALETAETNAVQLENGQRHKTKKTHMHKKRQEWRSMHTGKTAPKATNLGLQARNIGAQSLFILLQLCPCSELELDVLARIREVFFQRCSLALTRTGTSLVLQEEKRKRKKQVQCQFPIHNGRGQALISDTSRRAYGKPGLLKVFSSCPPRPSFRLQTGSRMC